MGYEAPELTKADVLAEINKLLTCTTNKITDAVVAHIDADISAAGGIRMVDIWGAPSVAVITMTNSATDFTLSNVVIPDLGTYTIQKAYAMFHLGSVLDTSGASNWSNTDTFIQVDKAAAGYINALSMPDSLLRAGANLIEMVSLTVVGSLDISSRVTNNATTNFKWTALVGNATGISMAGIRTGIRLIVS